MVDRIRIAEGQLTVIMLSQVWGFIQAHQPLVGSVIAVLGAAGIGPWLTSKYARRRAYWERRLGLVRDLISLLARLRSLPSVPNGTTWSDISPEETPALNQYVKESFELMVWCELIYEERSLEREMIRLLPSLVFLSPEERVSVLTWILRFLEGETKGESLLDRLGWLMELFQYHKPLLTSAKRANPHEVPGAHSSQRIQESFQRMAEDAIHALRRWGAARPWRWRSWWIFERNIRGAKRRIQSHRERG